jgi:hypothetical protein
MSPAPDTGACAYYRQPAVAKADETVDIEAFAIRASMSDDIRHFPKKRGGNRFVVKIEYARYSTHGFKGVLLRLMPHDLFVFTETFR